MTSNQKMAQTQKGTGQGPEQKLKFTTDILCEVTKIDWELKNFKALTEIKESLKSAKLQFEAGRTIGIPSKWSFFMRREADEIGVYLELLGSERTQKEVFARFDTVIKRHDGTNFQRLCTETINMKGIADWGWNNIGSPTTLLSPKSNILVDGCLIIQFHFEIYAGNTFNSGKLENEVIQLRTLSRSAVADDLISIYNSGINADFVIQMKDLKKFNVHRLILAARSPVFLVMFETKMKEKATGCVEIEDISSEAMEVLLKHVYSGSLDDDWIAVAGEVIYAAEKYNMPLLKNFCDKTLINACTNDSALDFFKLAKLHNLENAIKDISEFIKTAAHRRLSTTLEHMVLEVSSENIFDGS